MITNTAIFSIIAIVLASAALFWLWRTEQRLKKFFIGKNAKNMEEIFVTMGKEIETLKKLSHEASEKLTEHDARISSSMRGVGMVRFNPFPESGGGQSFSTALIDEKKDGIIISTMYARERMSVFGKPIKNGKSEFELSEEEKKALLEAEKRL